MLADKLRVVAAAALSLGVAAGSAGVFAYQPTTPGSDRPQSVVRGGVGATAGAREADVTPREDRPEGKEPAPGPEAQVLVRSAINELTSRREILLNVRGRTAFEAERLQRRLWEVNRDVQKWQSVVEALRDEKATRDEVNKDLENSRRVAEGVRGQRERVTLQLSGLQSRLRDTERDLKRWQEMAAALGEGRPPVEPDPPVPK